MVKKTPDGDDSNVLQEQIALVSTNVKIWTLYRYATILDYAFLFGGTICAILGGAALPLISVIFGKLAGIFQNAYGGELTSDECHVKQDKSCCTLLICRSQSLSRLHYPR